MIERLPSTIDVTQGYLVDYWANELGVTRGRLVQAVGAAGPSVAKVRASLKDGYRIAIRDESGVDRLVARITVRNGAFGVSVPYHPCKSGWLFELPLRYDVQGEYARPVSDGKHFTVEDAVKLSVHMSGFVQFSSAGGKPITSGYDREEGRIRGAGVRAPDPVRVTTGPLFGIIFQGLGDFHPMANEAAEVFEPDDLWAHPHYTTPEDTAYNLEVFMLPANVLPQASLVGAKRLVRQYLPFYSLVKFPFNLRVFELPRQPYFLGAILSRIRADATISSGYKMSGPGCGGPGEAKKSIGAWYPRPDFVAELNPTPLDYKSESEPGD